MFYDKICEISWLTFWVAYTSSFCDNQTNSTFFLLGFSNLCYLLPNSNANRHRLSSLYHYHNMSKLYQLLIQCLAFQTWTSYALLDIIVIGCQMFEGHLLFVRRGLLSFLMLVKNLCQHRRRALCQGCHGIHRTWLEAQSMNFYRILELEWSTYYSLVIYSLI